MKKIVLDLTEQEAEALASAAEIGTADDSIDHIGWDAAKKSAYRRAAAKLARAISKR